MRYIIQIREASNIAHYIRETLKQADITGEVEQDRTLIEFDQATYDYLSDLPSDSDGHIDDGGNIWFGGVDWPVGRL